MKVSIQVRKFNEKAHANKLLLPKVKTHLKRCLNVRNCRSITLKDAGLIGNGIYQADFDVQASECAIYPAFNRWFGVGFNAGEMQPIINT